MFRLSLILVFSATSASCHATESLSVAEIMKSLPGWLAHAESETETCGERLDCVCTGLAESEEMLRLCPLQEPGMALYETFRPDGSRVVVCTTKGKKFHGVCQKYYPNGSLAAETRFAHGCHHGEERTWHINGVVASESHYTKGAPDGRWVQRAADGEITTDTLWERGRAVRVQKRNEQGELEEVPVLTKEAGEWGCVGAIF